MNQQDILDEIVALLEANGITVRNEPMGGCGGGLCTVRNQPVVFLDTDAPVTERAAVAGRALNSLIDIQNIYLRPETREFVERQSSAVE